MGVRETQNLSVTLRQKTTNDRVTLDTDAVMIRLTLDIATRTLCRGDPRPTGPEIEHAIKILPATAFQEATSAITLLDWLPRSGKANEKWATKSWLILCVDWCRIVWCVAPIVTDLIQLLHASVLSQPGQWSHQRYCF